MRKLAVFAFSFSGAISLACYGLVAQGLLLPLGGGLALLAGACALPGRRDRRALGAVLALLGLAVGFLWTALYSHLFFRPAQALDGRTVELTATVADWPQQGDYGGCSVLVRVDAGGLARPGAILYTDEQGAALRPGDQITAIAHMTLGDRTFSGQPITYYTAKGIFLRGECYGRLAVTRPERTPISCWPAMFSRLLKQGIASSFPPEQAGVVQALVTGNRDALTDRFTTSLQRTGLSHTVAVSGMHLAFLAGLLTTLLGRGKRSTAVLTVAWAVFFCGVAGNTPSVIRAAVMIVLLQLAPLLGRERDGPTALALALMVLLAANPFSAAHVGLQLSFAAVAGILAVSDHVQRWLLRLCRLDKRPRSRAGRHLRRVPYFMVSTLSATLGASVFTIPLVALHFKTMSLIAPLANLMTLWAVAILFVGGLAAGLAGAALPWLGAAVAALLTPLVHYLQWAVELLSRPALAALSMSSFYYWAWMVFFYLLLALSVGMKGQKRPLLPICAGAGALVLAIALDLSAAGMGAGSVSVLDVGQGQSVALRLGEELVLVDCGGDGHDDAGDVAADYIQSMGRGGIDLLVLSHFHADHANGVPQLLSRLRVDAIALPDVEEDSPLRAQILALAREKDIQVLLVDEGREISLEGGSLTLYPPMEGSGEVNELGLAVLVRSGGFSALIPGDMERLGELELLARADLPQVDLLVAGHHGSATSTTQELLDQIRPEHTAISVGADNRYGHPDSQVLDRLAALGSRVYRTDLNGHITVTY